MEDHERRACAAVRRRVDHHRYATSGNSALKFLGPKAARRRLSGPGPETIARGVRQGTYAVARRFQCSYRALHRVHGRQKRGRRVVGEVGRAARSIERPLDDWADDNYDHSGLGFIGGAWYVDLST